MFIVFLKNCTLRLYAFMTLCFLIRNIEKYSKIGYCRDSGNALNYEFLKDSFQRPKTNGSHVDLVFLDLPLVLITLPPFWIRGNDKARYYGGHMEIAHLPSVHHD